MYENWDEDYDDDVGYDEGESASDEFETPTVSCSHCGADVYEEAVACPVCGEYIGVDTSPFRDRPPWWISLGILGVIATILCLIFLA